MAVDFTFSSNTVIASAETNANNTSITNGSAFTELYRCYVYDALHGAVPTSTNTYINWDSEVYDVGPMHSVSTNPSRIIAPADGYYDFNAYWTWPSNNSGYRSIFLRLNGTTIITAPLTQNPVSGVSMRQHLSATVVLAENDYIELGVFQSSGGDLTPVAGQYESFVTCHQRLMAD